MGTKFGKTYSIGNKHNMSWLIGDNLGNPFENNIHKYILMLCKGNKKVKIEQTPLVNDGGKDVVLSFIGDSLTIFGITFKGQENEKTTIYIECKSTNSEKLRREKFVPSIDNVIHSSSKIDYFVLLTNSIILAKDHYYAKQTLEDKGIKFVLIDQYILARQLMLTPFPLFTNFNFYNGKDHFYLEYQVYKADAYEDLLDIYFVFRNYSSTQKDYTLSLLTNMNWITDSYQVKISVEPYDSFACKITLKYENESDYNDINFSVFDGDINHPLVIASPSLPIKYIPPFIGGQHKKAVDSIALSLQSETPDKLFCLWGDAGVGKTRITSELIKVISDSNFDIFYCVLKTTNKSTVKEICSFLKKKGYIKQERSNDIADFKETVLSCQDIIKVAVIIIDDFHNSSKQLMDQIQKLKSHSAPVVLILCGRTDYSAGNTNYYAFVEWTNQCLIKNKTVWNIEPLKTEDTKNFIHSSMQNIPDAVFDSILRNSHNNPLYIVQYVEHLLDEKIAYLESENTVSIYNTYKFKLIDFLPKKINEIYEKRIRFVQKAGKEYKINFFMFLLIITMYNGQISESDAREFDFDMSKTNFLEERRFIKKHNHAYMFVHESIRIFLTEKLMNNIELQKKLGNEMLAHKDKISVFPEYMKARLYFWTGQNELALKGFEPIISDVSSKNNFSNISIDTSVYDYIDDILDIIKYKEEYKNVAKKLINTKIYITLHYFIPINAIRDCNKCLNYISQVPFLKDDRKLTNSICAQKAHSLLNSGMNFEGILILNELQAKLLIDKDGFNYQSMFDIADRLCAIYIKFNCYSIALEYSNIEIKIAKENNDDSLLAIAYRTRSKLFYLKDFNECQNSLNMVDSCLQKSESARIGLNNRIYRTIVNLSDVDLRKDSNFIYDVEEMAREAWANNFNRAYIQSNLVLATLYLKRGEKNDLLISEKKAITAINYSVRFGIPSYLWQLYNIISIINIRLDKSKKEIERNFFSAYNILRAQNLLFIGKKDLCYSNILAISNIAYYLRHNCTQRIFNSHMSAISFFHEEYSDKNTIAMPKQTTLEKEALDQLYEITNTPFPELLFCSNPKRPLLKDNETGYFIALT